MNDKIKAILEKHFNMDLLTDYDAKDLKNAIIEICEEQKKECAKLFEYHYQKKAILNSKNIALLTVAEKTRIMNLQEFKLKYFTNNFYWVNENNYKQLQEIALEVGCLCHTGKKDIINWHEGFKNLGFRTYEKNNNVTVFQKEPFLMHNENATNFDEMLDDYENVATCA